jgi:hypothetical protein
MKTASNTLKPFQTVDTATGEVINKYKYLEGHPRQYRFDAKEGKFNINGTQKLGSSFSFQPIGWRIFKDNILGMGQKTWAEIFFTDEKNCVSTILFHGYSVEGIFKLIDPLYYDDLSLADVVITATASKRENTKITPKGVYYLAEFSYSLAPKERTEELKAYALEINLYRQETISDLAEITACHNYFNPLACTQEGERKQLETSKPGEEEKAA